MSDPLRPIVDIDDQSTWPDELAILINELADRTRAANGDLAQLGCSDLELWEHEQEVRALLESCLLRAYHATRLLAYEAEAITTDGMRPLDRALLHTRLSQAHARGHLSRDEHDVLAAEACIDKSRTGRICLFLSRAPLLHRPHGFHRLLSTWGGESLYWSHADNDNALRTRLRSLGQPTIIVTDLDLSVAADKHTIWPGSAPAFVGSALGLHDVGANINYFAPITPDHIAGFIRPGDPGYPTHSGLPQR